MPTLNLESEGSRLIIYRAARADFKRNQPLKHGFSMCIAMKNALKSFGFEDADISKLKEFNALRPVHADKDTHWFERWDKDPRNKIFEKLVKL